MTIFCFENSGEKMWEERALMADAERIRDSHPEKSCTCLREVAKKLYQPETFELAAKCYYESRDYEQTGNIYLEECREPRLRKLPNVLHWRDAMRRQQKFMQKAVISQSACQFASNVNVLTWL